jgi:O-antigen ligase
MEEKHIGKNLLLYVLIGAILTIVLSFLVDPVYLLIFLFIAAVILFFLRYIEFGFCLMVALYPFIYLQLLIGQQINVPWVDVVGIFIFLAWGMKTLWLHHVKKQNISLANFPGLLFFILFFIASALSLLNAVDVTLSTKYVLRPLSFFYFIFVVLPYNLINTKEFLFKILKIFFGVGFFVSLMGLYSVIFPATAGLFRRAVPITIFGIEPLGTNHNLIAEVLVAVIPMGLILFWQTKDLFKKNLYLIGLGLMIAINLLTFSRNGWLTLALELIILIIVRYREQAKKFIFSYRLPLLLLIVIPLATYMYYFSLTPAVQGSNATRLRLTEIALDLFYKHPYIGNGVGSFIEEVARDKWFILDFGAPMEAHGVVQQLLAETGILGLVTFFSLLIYILMRIIKIYLNIKPDSEWKYIILALMITALGSISFQFFNTSYFVSKMWLPLGIALAATKLVPKSALKSDKRIS